MTHRSRQRTFNKVVKHLRKQGRQSLDTTMVLGMDGCPCRYKITVDGEVLKCAVGCLIPDQVYDTWMEGLPVLEGRMRTLVSHLGHDYQLLSELQVLHDTRDPHQWEVGFERIADAYGLVVPQLKRK